jgi:hypothetical protein
MSPFWFFVPSASTYLYDSLTAKPAVVVSMRLLNSAYSGYCLRVKRVSDNVEADVSFDSNKELTLDSAITEVVESSTSASNLGEFCAAGGYTDADSLGTADSVVCNRWYLQNSTGRYFEPVAAGFDMKLINSGTLITRNGKAAVYKDLDGNDETLILAHNDDYNFTDSVSFNTVYYTTTKGETDLGGLGGKGGVYGWYFANTSPEDIGFKTDSNFLLLSVSNPIGYDNYFTSCWQYNADSGIIDAYLNGVNQSSSSAWTNQLSTDSNYIAIGRRGNETARDADDFYCSEFLIWGSKLSSGDLSTLHTSQASYYGIS